MSIISEARAIRAEFLKMRDGATDATASLCPTLYPILKADNALIKAGTRINWNGVIKKASVDLWDTKENNPDNAPSLWEDLAYRDGIRIIPDIITVTTAFSNGELGWWKDELYKSLADNNVYTPEQYSAWWEKQINE